MSTSMSRSIYPRVVSSPAASFAFLSAPRRNVEVRLRVERPESECRRGCTMPVRSNVASSAGEASLNSQAPSSRRCATRMFVPGSCTTRSVYGEEDKYREGRWKLVRDGRG